MSFVKCTFGTKSHNSFAYKFGIITFFFFKFLEKISYVQKRLHLFDQKYSKNSNNVKCFYN